MWKVRSLRAALHAGVDEFLDTLDRWTEQESESTVTVSDVPPKKRPRRHQIVAPSNFTCPNPEVEEKARQILRRMGIKGDK